MSKLDKEDELELELELEELENNYEAIMANDEINLEEREIYGSNEARIENYDNRFKEVIVYAILNRWTLLKQIKDN